MIILTTTCRILISKIQVAASSVGVARVTVRTCSGTWGPRTKGTRFINCGLP